MSYFYVLNSICKKHLLVERDEFHEIGSLSYTIYEKLQIFYIGTCYKVIPSSYNGIGGVSMLYIWKPLR